MAQCPAQKRSASFRLLYGLCVAVAVIASPRRRSAWCSHCVLSPPCDHPFRNRDDWVIPSDFKASTPASSMSMQVVTVASPKLLGPKLKVVTLICSVEEPVPEKVASKASRPFGDLSWTARMACCRIRGREVGLCQQRAQDAEAIILRTNAPS